MTKPPHITDDQRRARLVTRHHLGRSAAHVDQAVDGMVASHSSDPATPYLAAWARVDDFRRDDMDRALYETRSLVRLHAMRRTLFVVPSATANAFEAGAARAIATVERRKLEGWLAAGMAAEQVPIWLADVEAHTLRAMADGVDWRTQDLSAAVGLLNTKVTAGSGKWIAQASLSSRLLLVMAMEGKVVRGRPAGSWRSSQYRWAATAAWFAQQPPVIEAAAGRAELARRYLRTFGPVTLADLRWWAGWTAKDATAALREIEAISVTLDGGSEGFLLPDDLITRETGDSLVALLPGLDSTPMGWKERDWYLGAHGSRLFDRNGNVGPTVWVGGRIVGGWAQRADGKVVHQLLEPVDHSTTRRINAECAALTEWLAGVVVVPRFRTPLERELSA